MFIPEARLEQTESFTIPWETFVVSDLQSGSHTISDQVISMSHSHRLV